MRSEISSTMRARQEITEGVESYIRRCYPWITVTHPECTRAPRTRIRSRKAKLISCSADFCASSLSVIKFCMMAPVVGIEKGGTLGNMHELHSKSLAQATFRGKVPLP